MLLSCGLALPTVRADPDIYAFCIFFAKMEILQQKSKKPKREESEVASLIFFIFIDYADHES